MKIKEMDFTLDKEIFRDKFQDEYSRGSKGTFRKDISQEGLRLAFQNNGFRSLTCNATFKYEVK